MFQRELNKLYKKAKRMIDRRDVNLTPSGDDTEDVELTDLSGKGIADIGYNVSDEAPL